MKRFLQVFRFEFANTAKNKIFIGLTAVLLAVITGVLFFPAVKGESDTEKPAEVTSLTVIDNTQAGCAEFLKAAMTGYDITVIDGDRDSAEKLVESGELDSAIVINSPLEYTYIVNNLGLYDTTSSVISDLLLTKYKNDYLVSAGLSQQELSELNASAVSAQSVVVGQDLTKSFFYTYIIILLLYMAVMIYGQTVAQSIVTEKSSKAMELLITGAGEKNLIFGKILGNGLAGLSQLVILLVWSAVCYRINLEYWEDNMVISSLFGMDAETIALAVLFFIPGFLLYAFLYGAASSLASKAEEVGTLTMPITFIMIIAFLGTFAGISMNDPENMLLKALSYVPFSAPMAMFARLSMNLATPLQAAVSLVILIASVVLIGYAAVAIYKIGILMYGKPPKFNELIRALKNR